MARQTEPTDGLRRQSLSLLGQFNLAPLFSQARFEGKQVNLDSGGAELSQVGQHLRLHQRFANAEIAEVECAD